jgi:hypothetical protein
MSGSAIATLHPRHPALTAEELFELFRAAIKDDDRIINSVIQTVYDDLLRYDSGRARGIMELLVRREPLARSAFQALLTEARLWQSRAVPAEDLPAVPLSH